MNYKIKFGLALTGHVLTDENKDNFQKLRSILQTFGRATGVRGILWQQGESDCGLYAGRQAAGLSSYYLADYETGLSNLIKWSRKAVTGSETNASLNWFVSKTSLITATNTVNWTSGDPSSTNLSCAAGRIIFTKRLESNGLRAKQPSVSAINLGNVFQGIDSDFWKECYRSSYQRIHFSGNEKGTANDEDGLIKMANGWHDIIFNPNGTYKNTSVQNNMVLGNALLALAVTDNTPSDNADGNYRLTAPSGYSKYFWVKDNQGIYDVSACNCPTKDISAITGTPEYWTCYVSNANDVDANFGWDLPDLSVTQTFISRNTTDAINRGLRFSTNGITFPANPIDKQVTVISNSVVWDVLSKPAWTTTNTNLGGFGETPLRITVQANTTGADRPGEIKLRDRALIIPDQTLSITQYAPTSGGGNCSQTNLSTLTPTNPEYENGVNIWSGWGSKHNNQSVEGNALQVGGYQPVTGTGIGVHAGSRLVYNLGGQYGTFGGSVGRDDEADNCGCGDQKLQFIIKVDGVTKFTSLLLGTTDVKQAFNVDIAGKSTLELLVNDGGDNYYGDHADWLDAILYCGAAPTCNITPPTTGAAPAPINAGGSATLTANCATGSVTWSTGAVANSITVSPTVSTSYTAKCVSGSCESSTISIGVTVNSGGCGISDGMFLGTWYPNNVESYSLIVRSFNGSYWLTQRISTNPDAFVVRGSAMMQRSDVVLANGSYANMISCFAWIYSNYGNLQVPDSQTFPTPSGYTLYYSQDGTPYYQTSGAPPSCTNTDLSNNWSYASSDYNAPPKINAKHDNSTPIRINNTNFAKGIGTHANSEIIYTLGSHNFTNFKASVGRDFGSYSCGCGGQTIVFKVYDNSTGALIGGPITKGINQDATDMTVPITGISSIKLVVEDGGDAFYGDWADWGNARLTCANNNLREGFQQAIPEETIEGLSIFPNPTNDKLTTKFSLAEAAKISFDIVDLQGRNLDSYQYKGEAGLHTFIIDVSKLNEGSYILRGMLGNKLEIRKFVVER